MTGDETPRERDTPAPVTYHGAQVVYAGTHDARERFDELTNQHLMARSEAVLKARGEYDPQKYGPEGEYAPLTTAEHLELLAAGEVLARYYRHPARVHDAADAGATWQQIADATGVSERQARDCYREWADGQHSLWQHYEGKFGMSEAEHAEAMLRLAEPGREAGQ